MPHRDDNNASQPSMGEHIIFYGDFASISPDVHMRGGGIETSKLYSTVKEHKDDTYLTVMDTDYISLDMMTKQKVLEINPNTQFVQVSSLKEFTEYYDRGMDRKLHPVESVTAIEGIMFYDFIEKEQPEAKTEIEKPREYIKAADISTGEMMEDLISQINRVTHMKPQEFLDFMGLKDDVDSTEVKSMISFAKRNLKNEFLRDYALPQAGKTAAQSIDKVIPGMPAKSIKEGAADAIEFAYDMVGDKDRGHLAIDYECTSLSDCHIKGVYREHEDTKEATHDKTDEATIESIEVDERGRVIYDHESNIGIDVNQLEETDTFDPAIKAQEIVDSMNLPEYNNSMEYNNTIEMD